MAQALIAGARIYPLQAHLHAYSLADIGVLVVMSIARRMCSSCPDFILPPDVSDEASGWAELTAAHAYDTDLVKSVPYMARASTP
ncbi:hypothetical protein FOMPIDRAFT_1026150 [Fomitopsis schrenkii]|uniref:Uncharacterized protein n=1 Tax=Fomitopsis schrenkii TaxID=2126942 RepID=S8DTK3_FOMSC|nr:hypothetical protein FOMPIDRAFT_1026150 [Fomitopsis schrenkii]